MVRRLVLLAILCAPFLGALGSAYAAGPYSPALEWRTVESPRFRIHYPDGGRNIAVRVSRAAEDVVDDVCGLFGFAPEGRIEVVLVDNSDLANGSAQVLPKNTIRMFLTAPTELTGLSSYDDWLRILLIHEVAHICDIDQNWGFTKALRGVFGKYVQWNGLTPQFLSEGVAVYAETLLTPTGRGRSSYVSMILRTAALEEQFLRPDQANVFYSEWPGPNAAYFYGGHFHLWLARNHGVDAVRKMHRLNAGMPVPYLYYPGAKAAFGKSIHNLWQDWKEDEVTRALDVKARVEAQGETESTRLTFHGRNITGTRFSPDGSFIIYSRSSPIDGSTVRRLSPDGKKDEQLLLQVYSPRFSFDPAGEKFYYSQNAINERFNNFNDIYRYDTTTDRVAKLEDVDAPKKSLRARDPDVSPDGKRVVFVQNRLHQSWLSEGTFVDSERTKMRVRVLVPPHGDMQQASPRYSPDGKMIAVSTWFEGGMRDIVLIDADTGALRHRLTRDIALDGNPAWSPDSRYVLYESDADGISNIFAYDTQEHSYHRITRVVGGAFQPDVSPDNKRLLFRNATAVGFDIHSMPYDPATWDAVEYDPGRGYLPWGGATDRRQKPMAAGNWPTALPREAEPPAPLRLTESDIPYRAWKTLLPFQDNWVLIPALFFQNGDPTGQLTTLGTDSLLEHTYQLTVGSSVNTRTVTAFGTYLNDMWYPTFGASGGQEATYFGGDIIEVTRSGSALVSLPILQRHLLAARYIYEDRDGKDALSRSRLRTGNFSYVELGYTYRFARLFPYSVGSEHGGSASISGRWYGEALGADFNEFMLSFDVRGYLNNPLFDNHVLALRFVGAVALGPDFQEQFFLGGSEGTSLFSVQTDRVYPLRGFQLNSQLNPPGTGIAAAYLEYRFPLWHAERGLWTLPLYIERLHMAVFVDAGNTFGDGTEEDAGEVFERAYEQLFRAGKMGTGAELRLDLNFGWAFPLTFRGGLAWKVFDRGKLDGDGPQFFLSFGTTI